MTRRWMVVGVVAVTAAAVAGAGLGAGGRLDLADDPRAVVHTADAVAFHACPDEAVLGSFHGGDRVYAVGRTAAGDWLAVRSPQDPRRIVWVRAATVEPDDDVSALGVVPCGLVTTPTTEPTRAPTGAVGTPTSTGVVSPTTGPAGTAPSSTAPPPTFPSTTAAPTTGLPTTTGPAPPGFPSTTGAPLDTTPPIVASVTASPNRLWEDAPSCVRLPRSAGVAATVTDDGGVASVSMTYAVGGSYPAVVAMVRAGDTWTATVGPFPAGTVMSSSPIVVTVDATDAIGNRGTRTEVALITLEPC